ncbi:MAG: hypothetical protein IT355_21045 [Gemmatimonadaceae bacterium]|nr:hypothetical protein [Gemmatimonadaceae bacterium]
MPIVETLSAAFEPWATMYGESTALSVALTFAHLGSMMVGGGLAIAADRTVLRAGMVEDSTARVALAGALADVHRPVVIALVVSAVSGGLQLAADVETFVGSKVMWVKVGLLVLLAVNGALMLRDERAVHRTAGAGRAFGKLRIRAVASLVLWLAITLAGVGLMQG